MQLSYSNGQIQIENCSIPSQVAHESRNLQGILGLTDSLLVVFTAQEFVGQLFGKHEVYRITAGSTLPLDKQVDGQFVDYTNNLLSSGRLYYSPTYDLSKSLQRQGSDGDDFLFNHSLIQQFSKVTGNDQLPTRVICGHVGTFESTVGTTEQFNIALIARYSRQRLGTRYTRRGIDSNGYVANFVEMEQLVWLVKQPDNITSWSQIRGSVPTFWKQTLDLAWKPKMSIAPLDNPKVASAIHQHFDNLKQSYSSPIVCLNLLNDSGFELPLTQAYETSVKSLADPSVQYEGFAVNRFCKKMNYAPLKILMDRIKDRLDDMRFYHVIGKKVVQVQSGTTRTSCLDSLDRTNMVATLIAKDKLSHQIATLLSSKEPIPLTDKVEWEVNNLYADAGDAISLQYSGTGHMKSDVVRTGKRQWIRGSIDDGWNSLSRYYYNNFQDGKKQDSLDVWTGNTTSTPSKSLYKQLVLGDLWQNSKKFAMENHVNVILALFILFVKFLRPPHISGLGTFFLAMLSTVLTLVLCKVVGVDKKLLIDEPVKSKNTLPGFE